MGLKLGKHPKATDGEILSLEHLLTDLRRYLQE